MKKIEDLFQQSLGFKFDTRKQLNRSEKKIPAYIIDGLESGSFTCEDIENLKKDFPIFRYQTCITIHGKWEDIERTRIGNYKNVHQNQNGSVEIRYSAIDRSKIETIRQNISGCSPFRFYENSSERNFHIHKPVTKETFDSVRAELQPIAERLTKCNIYGHVSVFVGRTMWGTFLCLEVYPLAIPDAEVLNFSLELCGLSQGDWEVKKVELKKIQDEEEEQRRQDAEKRRQESAIRLLETKKQVDAMKPQISHLEECDDINKGVLVKIVDDRGLCFVYFRLDGKGAFGRWNWSRAKSDTFTDDLSSLEWKSQRQRTMDDLKMKHCRVIPSMTVLRKAS